MITTVIVSSPIPTHPSTEVIDRTIESVRDRLSGEIILCFDGIRDEQLDRKEDYQEYIRRMLIRYKDDPYVTPLVFPEHTHQVGMVREALEIITTPYVQFVEQDTPLIGEIPYEDVCEALGEVSLVRFSHEASVLDVHKHMYIYPVLTFSGELPAIRTIHYSARPHVARTEWYRWVLADYFPADTREFIEDRLYGIILSHGLLRGWEKFGMVVYHPTGNICRSIHTDGRRRKDGTREQKYDGVGSG